jgi:hypothetical protein
MISECLNDINNPTELHTFFDQKSPYKYGPIMICPDNKRNQHNHDVSRYNLDARELNDCGDPFNVRNLNDCGLLQAGYSRKIDLDSELKKINHFDDKCYYDNYKVNPYQSPKCSGLYENRDVIVKDYKPIGKKYSYSASLPHIETDATNPNAPDKFNWEQHDYYIDKCARFEEFKQCPTPKAPNDYLALKMQIEKNNLPRYYEFHQSDSCTVYPCQRLFYNFTKRKTIPNFHNLQSIDAVQRERR